MRKLFGIKVKNIIVIWIFVDLLINIGLFICGFFISKSLALSFNPYLWLIVSIIGNFVLSSVVSFDKWRGFVDSWQIVAIIITCMHTISAVYLVIAVIASIITIFNIMNNILKSTKVHFTRHVMLRIISSLFLRHLESPAAGRRRADPRPNRLPIKTKRPEAAGSAHFKLH